VYAKEGQVYGDCIVKLYWKLINLTRGR